MDYLLLYDYVADYPERRVPFRDQHLALAWAAQSKGALILAGVLANPTNGAVFHFKCDSPSVIEAFIKADPYVQHGLVTRWQIREWVTAVGDAASTPVRPIVGG